VVLIVGLIYSYIDTVNTPGIPGGTEYICLLKDMTWSEIDKSEETLIGRGFFGIARLVWASVIACTLHGAAVPVCASSWVNMVTTPSHPLSISQRLSHEFRLG